VASIDSRPVRRSTMVTARDVRTSTSTPATGGIGGHLSLKLLPCVEVDERWPFGVRDYLSLMLPFAGVGG
jgi:hypothetical protein